MAKEIASFPEEVWDGLSRNEQRVDIHSEIEPNPEDWNKIVAELIATQEYSILIGVSGGTGVAHLDGSTITTLQGHINNTDSAGRLTGGIVTGGVGETVDVTTGTGLIRATDSDTAELVHFDWDALTGLTIPTDTTRWVGVKYNGGVPVVTIHIDHESIDHNTEWSLAVVVNNSGILHIHQLFDDAANNDAKVLDRLYETEPMRRDERQGGLLLSETGTRNVAMTAGNLWDKLSRFELTAHDTSVSGSFDTFYRDGIGGWTKTEGVTQWPNTQYDGGGGALINIPANRYANLWFYAEVDDEITMLYGQNEYTTLANAEAEGPPPSVPDQILHGGRLIGRLVFRESQATAESIDSVFDTTFNATAVTDHGNLSGLGDDDHTQYVLVSGLRSMSGDFDLGGNAIVNGTGSDLDLAFLGSSTYTTIQQMHDVFHSTGYLTGGIITDAGAEEVNIAAGSGLIRATTSAIDEILFCDWPASSGNAIPTDSTRWIGIEYNAGVPQVVIKSTYSWDLQTEFPLGVVINEGGILHISDAPHAVGDHATSMVQRSYETMPFRRDDRTGGLILGETGTRNINMSAGAIWERLSRFPISAIDTSGVDTFDTYYRDGVGGWTKTASVTQWPNTQYDDGSGTLSTMTNNNRYAVLWFYLDLDGELTMLYGQNEYVAEGTAQTEAPPTTAPDRVAEHARLIGRLIFKKSEATASIIESTFGIVFPTSLVTDHGNLGGLSDDDHTQYHNDARALTYIKTLIPSDGDLLGTDGTDLFAIPTATQGQRLTIDGAADSRLAYHDLMDVEVKNANFSHSGIFDNLFVIDITGDITATLSGTPRTGLRLGFKIRSVSNSATVTLGRNTKTINGVAADYVMYAVDGDYLEIVYDGTGWEFVCDLQQSHVARLTRSTAQSISNATSTKVLLATAEIDNAGLGDTATNNRIDIRRAGNYRVHVAWGLTGVLADNQNVYTHALLNGTTQICAMVEWLGTGATNADALAEANTLRNLANGDYIEMYVQHTEGAAQNTSTSEYLMPRLIVEEVR